MCFGRRRRVSLPAFARVATHLVSRIPIRVLLKLGFEGFGEINVEEVGDAHQVLENVDEFLSNMVVNALATLLIAEPPDVVVMALSLDFPLWIGQPKTHQDTVEKLIQLQDATTVLVAASGNRDVGWDRDDARFPGTCSDVLMIGAVDGALLRPGYSCYVLSDVNPGAFVVAPGGTEDEVPVTVGQVPGEPGTSIATAYAAGVAARSLGATASRLPRSHVYERLAVAARTWKGHDQDQHGSGLIQQVDLGA